MSSTDFQDRLQRINTSAQRSGSAPGLDAGRDKGRRQVKRGQFFLGAFFLTVGVQSTKATNERYEAIRDEFGIWVVILIIVAAILSLVIGSKKIIRALPLRGTRRIKVAPDRREASARAQTILSLLGFVFGAVASFYLFVAAAAQFIDTQTAQTTAICSFAITALLTLVALFVGFLGLFLQGRALGRMIVYFLLGALTCFCVMKFLNINLLASAHFVALMTG